MRKLTAFLTFLSWQDLDRIIEQEADELAEEPREKPGPRPKKAKYDKETFQLDSSGRYVSFYVHVCMHILEKRAQ